MLRQTRSTRFPIYFLLLLIAAGAALRLWRVSWQPLWWDEGYSVYFATEPLLTMLRLTAEDIHPPLYYALLHGWLLLWGSASPWALRSFSILIGVLSLPVLWWLARILFPTARSLALWAVLLLAISPMHLFYSQEVRMYGLEMLLGMVSTAFFWQMLFGRAEHAFFARSRVYYVLATTALLYTEYYAVLLPAAHFIWGLWILRKDRRSLLNLIGSGIAIALLYLPWLFYAIPALVEYIPLKVVADADQPLSLPTYLGRHLFAFLGGHVRSGLPTLWLMQVGTLGALAVLSGAAALTKFVSHGRSPRQLSLSIARAPSPISLVTFILLLALATGFVLNLRLPFFPEGGERVLLFVLPYFLLFVTWMLLGLRGQSIGWRVAQVTVGATLLLCGAVGVTVYFSTPRYTEHDYRPLIRQIVEQSQDSDTVFAVFPWQMGYWRTYAPVWGRETLSGPRAVLSPSPSWNREVAAALDDALTRGSLWFPAHLTLGAFLEREVEAYLSTRSVQFESRWYSTTTRLSGWRQSTAADPISVDKAVDFGALQISAQSRVERTVVASANDILPLTLIFDRVDANAVPLIIALRLLDSQDRVWASRDVQIDRLDQLLPSASLQLGLLVPVGVPPSTYSVAVGMRPADALKLLPIQTESGPRDLVPLASVAVTEPATPQSPQRLSIQQPLADPIQRDGIEFLGFSGYDPDVPTLAGTELSLSLFLHKQAPNLPPYSLFVGLLDEQGQGVAGWEGWPLADYPTSIWPEQALVRVPIAFYLPAALAAGDYTLVAGVIDPTGAPRSAPVQLGELPISQREIRVDVPSPQFPFSPPLQVGTHARLLGYDMAASDGKLQVILYWEIVQTLLPPHQVFFHLTETDGSLLAQDDGVPGRRAVSAPSGTWLPGEIIVDPHEVPYVPRDDAVQVIRLGLYLPSTGVRLPVLVNDQAVGDYIELPIP